MCLPLPKMCYKNHTKLGCQHRHVEYCDGEMLRGFMAWSFVQQCRYKILFEGCLWKFLKYLLIILYIYIYLNDQAY